MITIESLWNALPRDVQRKISLHDLKRTVDTYNAIERGMPCSRCGYCGFIEDADGNLAGECPECHGQAAKFHTQNANSDATEG
jgi:predicted Zn-ribbon and HTH transcriptional regulator